MIYSNQSISDFLNTVASQKVTPAGGTAAAIVGAIGTALCEMVCLHTMGEDEYADVEVEMAEIQEELGIQRGFLLELADKDAEVVDELLAAYRDDSDQTVAMKKATGVPLTIAEACLSVLEYATVVTEKGNRNAVPDAGTGSFLVYSALQASVYTVRTNLGHLSDSAFTEEMETRAANIERSADIEFEQVISTIE
ncbi:cyclodeaminase/cyclohydrolase family protein [Halocatena marina]|uniref:cyclodeaminase/cyclohydrolase family protein n=1 Tax=Halocatena marina TaxID=2934937 RepID=UPI00201048E3|nr:cyclodeaminase/cyclohydrolase family protein [Halocatena marina]